MNQDVLETVARYLDADPQLYCRLSAVSQLFRRVFTSDKVWKKFNPYGIRCGIYANFQSIGSADKALIRAFLACKERQVPEPLQNACLSESKYVLTLAMGLGCEYNVEETHAERFEETDWPLELSDDLPLLACLAYRDAPLAYRLASTKLRADRDFYSLCWVDLASQHEFIPKELIINKQFILELLKHPQHPVHLAHLMAQAGSMICSDPDVLAATQPYHAYTLVYADLAMAQKYYTHALLVESIRIHGALVCHNHRQVITREVIVEALSKGTVSQFIVSGRNFLVEMPTPLKKDMQIVKLIIVNNKDLEENWMRVHPDLKYNLEFLNYIAAYLSPRYFEPIAHAVVGHYERLPSNESNFFEFEKRILTSKRSLIHLKHQLNLFRIRERVYPVFFDHDLEEDALLAALQHGLCYPWPQVLGDETLENRKIALALMKYRPDFYCGLEPKLRKLKSISTAFLQSEGSDYTKPEFEHLIDFSRIPIAIVRNRESLKRVLNGKIFHLSSLPHEAWSDPELLDLALKDSFSPALVFLNSAVFLKNTWLQFFDKHFPRLSSEDKRIVWQHVPIELAQDAFFLRNYVPKYECSNPHFLKSRVIARGAVSAWPPAYTYLSQFLQYDIEFVCELVAFNNEVFNYLPLNMQLVQCVQLAAWMIPKDQVWAKWMHEAPKEIEGLRLHDVDIVRPKKLECLGALFCSKLRECDQLYPY